MKLLIVEDEAELLNSVRNYLSDEGFVCETALTYDVASDLVATYSYDCIIVDITLPGGSGLSLIEEIKKKDVTTGIIIVSAKNSLDDRIKGLEKGSDDYLTKPFHLSELNARIKALIRRNISRDQTLSPAAPSQLTLTFQNFLSTVKKLH